MLIKLTYARCTTIAVCGVAMGGGWHTAILQRDMRRQAVRRITGKPSRRGTGVGGACKRVMACPAKEQITGINVRHGSRWGLAACKIVLMKLGSLSQAPR